MAHNKLCFRAVCYIPWLYKQQACGICCYGDEGGDDSHMSVNTGDGYLYIDLAW